MGFLDSVVDRAFRDEKLGRVVVFVGDRRHRGYVVRSEAEELKIRSFLKVFFIAQVSIQSLGMFLATAWATDLTHVLGRPAEHLFRSGLISLGIYSLVVGLPFSLLWRSYKKALPNFVSPQDEVQVSGKGAGVRPWSVIAVLTVALALTILFVISFYLIRAK